MKIKRGTKIKYNKEADILSFEGDAIAKIDYACELGNVIVHFTKDNIPVLLEILNASNLLKQKALRDKIKIA